MAVGTGHGTAPLLKWPGGKTRELPAIVDAMPARVGRLVEPFVGGGAVLFATDPAVPAVANDASPDLVALYRAVAAQDPGLFARLDAMAAWWACLGEVAADALAPVVATFRRRHRAAPDTIAAATGRLVAPVVASTVASVPAAWAGLRPALADRLASGLPDKAARMRRLERSRHRLPADDVVTNLEGAVRAAVYTAVRDAYNTDRRDGTGSVDRTARFLFLREFAYAAMFRFNAAGDFNVPYGGVSYNRKSFADRVAHLASAPVVDRLAATELHEGDFARVLDPTRLRPDDVVFADPPYDSDFSDYDRRGFGRDDHARLAACLRALPCPFVLVIRDSPLVREVYADPRWTTTATDRTYAWTIKQRNDRRTTHLLVTG